jgi:hypothetical protein
MFVKGQSGNPLGRPKLGEKPPNSLLALEDEIQPLESTLESLDIPQDFKCDEPSKNNSRN